MYMVNIFAQSKATNQYFHVSPALERAHAISKLGPAVIHISSRLEHIDHLYLAIISKCVGTSHSQMPQIHIIFSNANSPRPLFNVEL